MPIAISPSWVWSVSGIMFLAGCFCITLRRQLLAMILGVELMINAANLALVYYAMRFQDAKGLAVALLVIALAAAEVVVGISLILTLHRKGEIVSTEEIQTLAG